MLTNILKAIVIFHMKVVLKYFPYVYNVDTNFHTHRYLHK